MPAVPGSTPSQPRWLGQEPRPPITAQTILATATGPRLPHRLPLRLGEVRLTDVAYDTELADRIRFLLGTGPGVSEKKMFGGLAFLVNGNMAISASGQGGALIRVDPGEASALVATANATPAVMGGRTMPGWLRVSSQDLEADDQLTGWVSRAVGYARSLPPKR
jgi:TfoX N-terminal domain